LYITHNYIIYLIINVVGTLINNLLLSNKADATYPFIKHKAYLSRGEKKDIYVNMKSVMVYKLASVIMTGTTNIIISVVIGTVAVGLYSNYYSITTNLLGSVIAIVFGSMTASVGNLIVKEKPEKRYEVFKSMQMVSFLISGFFIVCLYFLADDFIVLWIGKEYVLSKTILIAILMNFYLIITFHPVWSFREATGLYQKIKYILMATAVISIILSVILGKTFGLAGIMAATVMAKLVTYFWYEPTLLYKDFFEQKVQGYFAEHALNCIMILVCIIFLQAVMPEFREITIINWLLKAVICGSVVLFVYGIRYFKTVEFKMILTRMKAMMKA
jgi:O-antigen/teichoic acid export membrane protein